MQPFDPLTHAVAVIPPPLTFRTGIFTYTATDRPSLRILRTRSSPGFAAHLYSVRLVPSIMIFRPVDCHDGAIVDSLYTYLAANKKTKPVTKWRSTGRKTPDGKTLYACPMHPRELRVRKMRNVRAKDGSFSKKATYITPGRTPRAATVRRRRFTRGGSLDQPGVTPPNDEEQLTGEIDDDIAQHETTGIDVGKVSQIVWPFIDLGVYGGRVLIFQEGANMKMFKDGLRAYREEYNKIANVKKSGLHPIRYPYESNFISDVEHHVLAYKEGAPSIPYFKYHADKEQLIAYNACINMYLLNKGRNHVASNGITWRQFEYTTSILGFNKQTHVVNVINVMYTFEELKPGQDIVPLVPYIYPPQASQAAEQALVRIALPSGRYALKMVENYDIFDQAREARRGPPRYL